MVVQKRDKIDFGDSEEFNSVAEGVRKEVREVETDMQVNQKGDSRRDDEVDTLQVMVYPESAILAEEEGAARRTEVTMETRSEECSLQDLMEVDIKQLEAITGGGSEDGFTQSGKKGKKKKKANAPAIATRQSTRIIRDGVPVAMKAQKRTSEKNDISGINKFAIFNSVNDDYLISIAVDSGINLGDSEETIHSNIKG